MTSENTRTTEAKVDEKKRLFTEDTDLVQAMGKTFRNIPINVLQCFTQKETQSQKGKVAFLSNKAWTWLWPRLPITG